MIMWLEGMLIDRKSSERIILFQRSIVYMHLIMAVLGAFFQHLLFQKGKLWFRSDFWEIKFRSFMKMERTVP